METALDKVSADLFLAKSQSQLSFPLLILLILSASFNTVSHALLKILSFLGFRDFSSPGSPPVSPIIHPLCPSEDSTPYLRVISSANPNSTAISTNPQIYLCPLDLSDSVHTKVAIGLSDFSFWMSSHQLTLNRAKTELFSFPPTSLFLPFPICLGNTTILPATPARNLGISFPSDLSLGPHPGYV